MKSRYNNKKLICLYCTMNVLFLYFAGYKEIICEECRVHAEQTGVLSRRFWLLNLNASDRPLCSCTQQTCLWLVTMCNIANTHKWKPLKLFTEHSQSHTNTAPVSGYRIVPVQQKGWYHYVLKNVYIDLVPVLGTDTLDNSIWKHLKTWLQMYSL